MPVSKTPSEYYRYYCASQIRVEQWVQETRLQSQQCRTSQSDSVQWKGFLEDPGLMTPISMPCALGKDKSEKVISEDIHGDYENLRDDPRNHGGSSHDLKSKQIKVERPDDITTARSSSINSKKSKHSMRTISTSKTKPPAPRKRHFRTKDNGTQSMLVYLPYSVVPLLFAMTTGSSSVALAATSIMLAGYFCLDFKVAHQRSRE